jgi:hypothetical protein
MVIKKNNKNMLLLFRNKFLKVFTAREKIKNRLITKDNLVFKTSDGKTFILKESE